MDTPSDRDSTLAAASLAAAVLLGTLCALTLATGVSQQWFEVARPPGEYAAALVRDAVPLRAIIALDDLFIVAYVTGSVLFAVRLARGRLGPLHVLVMVGGVAAGVLDLEENHHILTMLRLAEQGVAIPVEQILRRSDLSQLKWMLGHAAFALAGVAVVGRDAVSRALRVALVGWQLPIGALAWTVTVPALAPVLLWARYLALLSGFVTIAWLSGRGGSARVAGVAGATGAPA
jgi:hypothetical protein